jgi:tripartite-type tricarboxylate transporter receptor subunit TctC
MRALLAFLCLLLLTRSNASAQQVSFAGKTVSMVIGYPAGGGTDLAGRLIASVLGRYLPGEPTIVVQNMPGAEGLTALNFFVRQAKSDGSTITMGSGSQADPTHYRKPQSYFDPTNFVFVGGAGRSGSALVINKEAERRLYNRSAAPVMMGTTSGAPRTNMQMAAWGREFLGWNLKWVLGYRGTGELFVALDRGEIDMTATSNITLFAHKLATGQLKIFVQSGAMRDGILMPRPEFSDAPLLPPMLTNKIADPIAVKAFDYWMAVHSGPEKWLALPPRTPDPVAEVYREAFARTVVDPEFIERSKKLANDITPVSYRDVHQWMNQLGGTSNQALEFIATMLGNQGVKID